MRTLILLATLSTAAQAAPPSYPIRITTVSQAERARRQAAFESREPMRWTEFVVNSRGFVVHLATEDPALPATLNGVDLVPIRELLRREAASFGIDPADLDADFSSLGSCGNQLLHVRNGAALGRIDITCRVTGDRVTVVIDVIPWLDVTPKLVPDDASKRVLGSRYAIVTSGWLRPARDCNMGGTCAKPRLVTRRDVVKLTPEDLIAVDSAVYRDGDRLRVVYCVDATWNTPDVVVKPQGAAKRLPYVVDAVTGIQLPLRPKTCASIPSID